MNIMHLLFSFNNGGSENLIVDVLNSWCFEQDTIYLCIVNDFYDQTLLNKIFNPNVEILKIGRVPGSGKFKGNEELRKIVKDKQIDIIHCHSINVLNYALLALGLPFKWKYILTIHNVSVYKETPKFQIFLQKLTVYKMAAISQAVKQSICSRGYPEKKVDVVYNGIDFSKYKQRTASASRRNKRVLCIGRMVPQIKGQDVLLRAMKTVCEKRQDVECYFAGGNPENHDYLKDMKALAGELGVEKNVCFLGDCHDVPKQLAEADLLVVPSREEGFGLVVVEGMAAKVPVIATKTGGPSEIITDSVTGYLVDCNQPEKMAEKIAQVLSSEQNVITENAYKYAFECFSIDNTVKETRKLYQ